MVPFLLLHPQESELGFIAADLSTQLLDLGDSESEVDILSLKLCKREFFPHVQFGSDRNRALQIRILELKIFSVLWWFAIVSGHISDPHTRDGGVKDCSDSKFSGA